MATLEQLETMAKWLEARDRAPKKYRSVTMSYLEIALGDCTMDQLRGVCRWLTRNPAPFTWLKLREIAREI